MAIVDADLAARTGWTGLKAAHAEWRMAIAAERAAAKAALAAGRAEGRSLWWAAVGGRLSNALSLVKATRDHLMFPFVHLGLAEKWAQRTLFQRLYPHLAWKSAHKLAWNAGGYLKDMVLHLPFSLAGFGWGHGLAARGVQMYGLYELTLWGVHSVSNVREAATVLVLERIQQDPATYGDLVEAMHQGEISHAELLTIVQLDDELGAKYRAAVHDWAQAFRQADTKEGRTEAVKNLESLEKTLTAEIAQAEGKGGNPQKARTWRRVLRDSKRIRLELSSTDA